MKATEFKKLINQIPDEAEVKISGADFGGYEVRSCSAAGLEIFDGVYYVEGFDTSDFRFDERLAAMNFVATTPLTKDGGEGRGL